MREVPRDVISVFPGGGGGKILTDFLGGAKYEETKCCVQKHTKITISQIQGERMPPCPPPNDLPGIAPNL